MTETELTVFFTAWMETEDFQSEDACAVVSRALLLRIKIFFGEKARWLLFILICRNVERLF